MTGWKLSSTYARRELRAGLSGFYVFLLCLVLGVGAVAAVQSVSRSLTESLRHDGREILGGDMEVRTLYAPLTAPQMDYFKKVSTKLSVVAETRAMVRRQDETRTSLAEVKAVDKAYPLYGTVEAFDDSGNPLKEDVQTLLKDAGALVPRDLLIKLEVKLGDTMMIGQKPFTIRGIFRKLPDSAASIGFIVAPSVLVGRAGLEETGLLAPGNPMAFEHRLALPGSGTPALLKAYEDQFAKVFPNANWRVRNFYNASPRLERYIERLTFFLTLIGLTTLVVGGVGISNAVRAYLDTKLANIATLKCVGAPGSFVFRVYMLQMMMLAAAGIAIGAGIGAGGAALGSKLLAEQLALSAQGGFYPEAIALSALFGLLVTLAFSLYPIGRAMNVAPADLFRDTIAPRAKAPSLGIVLGVAWAALSLAALAIATAPDMRMASWFTLGTVLAIGIFLLFAHLLQEGLKKLKAPRRPEARMAVANLTRPGNVTSGAVLSLGLGLTVLITIALVEYNFSRLLKDDLSVDAPSFFFLDIQANQRKTFEDIVKAQPSGRSIRLSPNLRGRITKVNGVDAEQALKNKTHEWVVRSDRSFTYATEMPAHSTIQEGAWWPVDYKGPPLVSIATDVADAFDIGAGDTLTTEILGNEITAKIANVREIEWASFTMNFAVTFAPGTLEEMPASYLATAAFDEKDETALQAQVARELPAVTSIRVREALETAGAIITTISQAVRVSAAVTLAAGALVLAGGVAAARRRHIYDAVVLKVLGASRARIARTFLLEYGLLGLMAVMIAAGIGTLSAWAVLTHIMHLPWKFSFLSLGWVALSCLALTLSAGIFGTWQALRQKPAPWLRNQ